MDWHTCFDKLPATTLNTKSQDAHKIYQRVPDDVPWTANI